MESQDLRIIGTSHISRQSINEIKQAFLNWKPDIVAVELDKNRLYGLMSKKKLKIRLYDIRRIGIKGFVFALIGAWASKKLGEIVGVMPGEDMKTAVRLARKNNAVLSLIDQDIEITLRRFSIALTWKERWNFIADIAKSIFKPNRELMFDLRNVPSDEVILKLISRVKERYPNVYRVLIEERNYVLAGNIRRLLADNPGKKVLAVIGAGHKKDVLDILGKSETEISYSFSVS